MVYEPEYTRVGVKAVTQWGKSDVTSLALDKIATEERERREKILIVSPSERQSGVIMGYVIQHLFDHPYLQKSIEIEGSLERLQRERSKKRITFKGGSEIFILTAIAKEVRKEATNLMGFGATICVPYDQKISTERGMVEIGEIVDKRLRLKVYSYNHERNRSELKGIKRYYKRKGEELLEIGLGDRKIRCTEDHPVFVKGKGYIPAKDIKEGDRVWVLG